MKKSSLTTAVVAGLAGAAGLVNVSNAVNINPDGLGQVLIYPYYTVNEGNQTLLSVVNTTDSVKAVKVRFLEGLNSREVLDFNLYLSPFDVWTAAVHDAGVDTGPAIASSVDNSCIVPRQLGAEGEPFKNFQYTGDFDDEGPQGLDRTREGYIEMIEMGTVVDTDLAAAATHTAAGVPLDCEELRDAWRAGGVWADDADFGMEMEPGGLFGGGEIVDALDGTNASYNADAIEGFFLGFADDPTLHTGPGSTLPSLANVRDDGAPLGVVEPGTATAVVFDNGTTVTMTFDAGAPDAVSALFMHNEIYNEFVTDAALGASSEWVLTFPTKRLHIESTDIEPFTDIFEDDGVACEPIEILGPDLYFNREEATPGNVPEDLPFSPPPPGVVAPGTNLCFEAQVLTFNQEDAVTAGASEVLGSRYAANINTCISFADGECVDGAVFANGWARLRLGGLTTQLDNTAPEFLDHVLTENDVDGDGFANQALGLPVTGFWVARYINENVGDGILANYSAIHKHRADRDGVTVDAATGDVILDGTGAAVAWS